MAGSTSDVTRDLFEWGFDPMARRVFLQTYIGVDEDVPIYNATTEVTRGLLLLDQFEGDIELWINSPGGDVEDALAIHDVIRGLSSPVHTVGHGAVSSAATLLLACGTGRRYVTPSCFFMHHEGTAWISPGNAKLHEAQLAHEKRLSKLWYTLMGAYTKHTHKWWERQGPEHAEVYFDARQMIRHGIADEYWLRNHEPEEE